MHLPFKELQDKGHRQHVADILTMVNDKVRNVVRKKGIMWKKFPSDGPPPPSMGIFTFFYRFFCHFISP